MSTAQIRKKIQGAIASEKKRRQLEDAIETIAHHNGATPTTPQIRSLVEFVRHVPFYLECGIASAGKIEFGNQMKQMMSELEAYWLNDEDLIPDHLGLLGIMDDTYASFHLLQSLFDYCQVMLGRPLLEKDLTLANQLVRQLIGESTAAELDRRVEATLGRSLVATLAKSGILVDEEPDPYWDGDTLGEHIVLQKKTLNAR